MTARAMVIWITLLAALGPAAQAAAEEPWYSVYRSDHRQWTLALSGGFTLLDLEGEGRYSDEFGDSEVSFDGTLDLDEVDTWWAEADLQLFRGQHLRFGYMPVRIDESGVLDSTIVVDGVTYDAGDQVDADLKLDRYELSFRSEIWLGEYVSIAPLVEVALLDGRAEISNRTLGVSEKEEALVPLPYLGLRGEVFPHPRIQLFVEGKGMTIGSDATTWDASGGVALHLTRNLSLMGRYRVTDYEVDMLGVEFDANLGGPQVGATLRF
ncbi:MAG: hypothetical protein ACQGVC_24760 [Myxococcota bacterium]